MLIVIVNNDHLFWSDPCLPHFSSLTSSLSLSVFVSPYSFLLLHILLCSVSLSLCCLASCLSLILASRAFPGVIRQHTRLFLVSVLISVLFLPSSLCLSLLSQLLVMCRGVCPAQHAGEKGEGHADPAQTQTDRGVHADHRANQVRRVTLGKIAYCH